MPTASAQNLVRNGSFDPPGFLTGWVVSGGFMAVSDPREYESGLYIGGVVAQSLHTTPGQKYLLSFRAMGDMFGQSFRIATLQVSWDWRILGSYTSPNNGLAEYPNFIVTAPSAATVLRFVSLRQYPGLDDVSVTPAPSTQPEIRLTSPVSGAIYTMGDNIPLRCAATAAAGRTVSSVAYYEGGFNVLAVATEPPFTATWTNLPPGTWVISARVTDSANDVTTAYSSEVTAVTKPTMTWSLPENWSVFTVGDNVPLTATLLYNVSTVRRLVLRAGPTEVHSFDGYLGNGNYSAVWSNATEGEFALTATAYDAAGNAVSQAGSILYVVPPGVLDQSQFYSSSTVFMHPGSVYAQTFTPAMNGELIRIEVPISPSHYAEVYPVTVTVVETEAGVPSGRVLGQSTIPKVVQDGQNGPPRHPYFLRDRPLLRRGALYGFIYSAPQTTALIIRTSAGGNLYRKGAIWRKIGDGPWEQTERDPNPDADMVFATYMIPRNRPPIADAGNDQMAECGAVARLDASRSTDPDDDPISFAWFEAGVPLGTNVTLEFTPSLGQHRVELIATDPEGLASTSSVQVVVRDRFPPSIRSATAIPSVLWPPNHQMVSVTVAADVLDACDATPHWEICRVRSSEPSHTLDWQITGPNTVRLRAERTSGKIGRVYTVTVAATDASGNSAEREVAVSVRRRDKE